jgi:hypothetical protein
MEGVRFLFGVRQAGSCVFLLGRSFRRSGLPKVDPAAAWAAIDRVSVRRPRRHYQSLTPPKGRVLIDKKAAALIESMSPEEAAARIPGIFMDGTRLVMVGTRSVTP